MLTSTVCACVWRVCVVSVVNWCNPGYKLRSTVHEYMSAWWYRGRARDRQGGNEGGGGNRD